MIGSMSFSREFPRKLSSFEAFYIFRFYYQKDEREESASSRLFLKSTKKKQLKGTSKNCRIHLLNQQFKKIFQRNEKSQ